MKKYCYIFLLLVIAIFQSCNTKETAKQESKGTETVAIQATETKPGVIALTETEFKTLVFDFEKNPQKWVFEGEKPCIVDCYADWCRPCKMIAPFFDTLALEYEGKVNFYKINVDKAQNLSYFFQIKSIPTVFFCQKGEFQYAVGANSIDYYRKAIDSLLLGR